MILVDANLLIYAHVRSLPQNQSARQWLDAQLNGTARVGLPWPSLLGFLRLATNPRVFAHAETMASAWDQVTEWLERPSVWIPEPTEHHREILGDLLRSHGGRANVVPDAHVAALAIEHGLVLCSTDGDFARFPGLKWDNPLARASGRG